MRMFKTSKIFMIHALKTLFLLRCAEGMIIGHDNLTCLKI